MMYCDFSWCGGVHGKVVMATEHGDTYWFTHHYGSFKNIWGILPGRVMRLVVHGSETPNYA